MADNTIVHFGENSPEQVAFKLMTMVLDAEKKTVQPHLSERGSAQLVDRKFLLDTYAECLLAVVRPFDR